MRQVINLLLFGGWCALLPSLISAHDWLWTAMAIGFIVAEMIEVYQVSNEP